MTKLPLRPIKNYIFFEFTDRLVKGAKSERMFETISTSGVVIMADKEDSAQAHRWVTVLGVGPDVDDDIQIGSTILVEALAWTNEISVDDEVFWKTDQTKVLVYKE